jgi:hypothetical protein
VRTAGSGAALALTIALAGAGAGCDPDTVTLPQPPMAAETAQLVSLYQMPTGTINTDNIDQAFADARARVGDLQLDWFPALVTSTLASLKTRLQQGGLPSDPGQGAQENHAQITAVVEAHRICEGWDNPIGPPNEAANGAIDMTTIIDTGKINAELWATATACRAHFPSVTANAKLGANAELAAITPSALNPSLDGTLIIYLLGPLPSSLADAQFLITFNGSIGLADQVKSISFDFEYVSGAVKFRVPAGGGDVIVSVGTTFGIQGANASFSCDLTALTCQAS